MKLIKTKTLLIISGVIFVALLGISFFMKNIVIQAVSWNELSLDKVSINWLPEDLSKEGSDEGLSVLLMYDQHMDNYRDLYENSDMIALVSATDRHQFTNTMQTEVTIHNIYKGETADKISIYEPVSISDKNTIQLHSIDLPMRDNQQYLVFLKQIDESHYNLTSSLYGKFNVNTEQLYTIEFPLDNQTYRYEDMKTCDMLEFVNEGNKEVSDQIYAKRDAIFLKAKHDFLDK